MIQRRRGKWIVILRPDLGKAGCQGLSICLQLRHRERSALRDLSGTEFTNMGSMRLYRASDALMARREAIEQHLFDRAVDLFELRLTVTLHDLTNTCFQGGAYRQPKARRGHSKEKRSDCPLPALAWVLDASGFVRRSRVFAGNVREHRTLPEMLQALDTLPGALAVSRERTCCFLCRSRGAYSDRLQAGCAPAQDALR